MTGVEAMFKMKYEEMDAKMLATVVCVGRELERRKKAFKKESPNDLPGMIPTDYIPQVGPVEFAIEFSGVLAVGDPQTPKKTTVDLPKLVKCLLAEMTAGQKSAAKLRLQDRKRSQVRQEVTFEEFAKLVTTTETYHRDGAITLANPNVSVVFSATENHAHLVMERQ
jgi:hypothetical protein